MARTEISSLGIFKDDNTFIFPDITVWGFFLVKCEHNNWQKYLRWWCWGHQNSPELLPGRGSSTIFQQFQNLGQGSFASPQTFLYCCCPHLKSFLYLCLSVPWCWASQSEPQEENPSVEGPSFPGPGGGQGWRCVDFQPLAWPVPRRKCSCEDLLGRCSDLMMLEDSLQKRIGETQSETWVRRLFHLILLGQFLQF